jgi:hypothetical protein
MLELEQMVTALNVQLGKKDQNIQDLRSKQTDIISTTIRNVLESEKEQLQKED